MADFSRELEVACRVAREAGRVIMEVYGTRFAFEEKAGDAGPVTEADTRANELIVSELRRAFPGDSIIAEETSRRDETRSPRGWYIDPLDGTREFVDRNGMFAVHVGLAVDGVAALGVVYGPVEDKLYAGVVGQGCTLEAGGVKRALRVVPVRSANAVRLLVSRSHKSRETGLIARELGITDVKEHGSVGLKCGLIAEGKADLYLHASPRSSRWDACAPEAVLRAAGGALTDFAGAPYAYDGVELGNVRGLVAGSADALPLVMPVVTRIARESGLLR